MNKKIRILLTIISILFIFTSCSNISALNKKKQNNFYYTNIVAKNITLKNNYKCIIIDTNFYREKDLNSTDCSIITNFIKALNTKYFISKPKNLPDKPIYKMLLSFDDDKFVINIYNNKYISVHPWDGYYEMDFIDMSNIPSSYNLFNLCNYLIPRQ